MKKSSILQALVLLLFALSPAQIWAQTASAQVEAIVVNAGKSVPTAAVLLTNAATGRTFKIKTDGNGKFVAIGMPYGDYEVEISSASGEKLYKGRTSVRPSATSATVSMKIDISVAETQTKPSGVQGSQEQGQQAAATSGQTAPKYTAEQIAEIKKQNERATTINALIQQVQAAMIAKKWQEAIAPLQQLIALDPTGWPYYSALGDAQLNVAQYEQAAASYEKGIEAAGRITVDPHNPISDPAKRQAGEAKMLTNEGNAYLKLRRNKEAVDAYMKAAAIDPNPAIAYFNLCATQYNTGNVEGALEACDKAIAADPSKADAYFIKGSLLIAESKTDKNGKVTAPPGTAEALNKYLELVPDGAHAGDVKEMLAYIGSKVESTYKPKSK